MDPREARKVLAVLEKRAGARLRLDPAKVLFGPQLDFVRDPAKMKMAVCSRRAGKSFGIAYMLLEAGLAYEREIIPYITLTRDTAKNILWPALNMIDKQLNIGLEFKENTGDVVLPNKARIVLRGCDDRTQIEKLRGPRYPRVVIDEAQAFPSFLTELIDDVLEPATIDFKGQIIVTGTPNASCRGAFYEMAEGAFKGAWSQHNWTLRDNPHLGDVDSWLSAMMKRRGWNSQNPTYLREYCGKWVRDTTGLVYHVDDDRNLLYSMDWLDMEDQWEYILGIDLGFNDPTAFCVVGANPAIGKAIAIESYKESGLIPSAVAARVEQLMERYDFSRIVADSGGFGKGYVEEMKAKYRIPVIAAEKKDKVGTIELMNGDLLSGATQVYLYGNRDLWDEMTLLQWHLDKLERGKFEEDKARFHNHLCDAFLYAWREARHHLRDYQYNPPTPGTDEWWAYQEALQEQHDEEQYRREHASWLEATSQDSKINWV